MPADDRYNDLGASATLASQSTSLAGGCEPIMNSGQNLSVWGLVGPFEEEKGLGHGEAS